jgi:dTDP-4-dehydrorhamnose 3,5-epimerase
MLVSPANISGVLRFTPRRFSDARGLFSESWNKRTLEKARVFLPNFVQDNHSLSRQVATAGGLHYQAPPDAQGKLVRCGLGRIFDVAVYARVKSPTYGHWHGEELSCDNGALLWIPAGFLLGFMTLEPESEIIYKCTDHCAP